MCLTTPWGNFPLGTLRGTAEVNYSSAKQNNVESLTEFWQDRCAKLAGRRMKIDA
jgi:hypothetical protein